MKKQTLDDRIRALCEARGLHFKPWQCLPWDVPDTGPSPWMAGSAGAISWIQAQALRRKLRVELRKSSGKK
jgi:hypothetical protein